MKFIPIKGKEKFFLPNFLMDNLIIFVMCGLVAFILPMMSGRHASNTLLALYNHHEETKVFRNFCMIAGGIVAIGISLIHISKFHIYSFEIKDNYLQVSFCNLIGKQKIIQINLDKNRLRIEYIKESQKREEGICIYDSFNKVVFSTELSKYWDYRLDERTLDEFIRVLNERMNFKNGST